MEIIPIIELLLTAAGIFIPSFIGIGLSRRSAFKAASAPLLIKLLKEIKPLIDELTTHC